MNIEAGSRSDRSRAGAAAATLLAIAIAAAAPSAGFGQGSSTSVAVKGAPGYRAHYRAFRREAVVAGRVCRIEANAFAELLKTSPRVRHGRLTVRTSRGTKSFRVGVSGYHRSTRVRWWRQAMAGTEGDATPTHLYGVATFSAAPSVPGRVFALIVRLRWSVADRQSASDVEIGACYRDSVRRAARALAPGILPHLVVSRPA